MSTSNQACAGSLIGGGVTRSTRSRVVEDTRRPVNRTDDVWKRGLAVRLECDRYRNGFIEPGTVEGNRHPPRTPWIALGKFSYLTSRTSLQIIP